MAQKNICNIYHEQLTTMLVWLLVNGRSYGVTYSNGTRDMEPEIWNQKYGTTENLYICPPIYIEKLRMLYMRKYNILLVF
jgi:hypothetical protein